MRQSLNSPPTGVVDSSESATAVALLLARLELVRAALRRLEAEESDYLTPPVLTPAQAERIFAPDREEDTRERRFGQSAFEAVRRAARKGRKP